MQLRTFNQAMYKWCDLDEEAKVGLLNFWFNSSCFDLAKVLLNEKGNKLIVNTDSFVNFEQITKRLLLFADILAIRDTRPFPEPGLEIVPIPLDHGKFERPELENLQRPKIMRMFGGSYTYTSDTFIKPLSDGRTACVAMGSPIRFPDDTYDWIFGKGKEYFETGQVIYAPFIPPIEVELEFLKQGYSLPETFGAQPLFSDVTDYLNTTELSALLKLNLPTLDNLDVSTLKKVKDDYQDEFQSFRNNIIESVTKVKSAVGTEQFYNEVKHIQRNNIDDSLSKLSKRVNSISKMQSIRTAGCFVGVAGLTLSAILGIPQTAVVAGATANLTAFIADFIMKMKEKGELKDNPAYFLWQLEKQSKRN